MNARWRGRRYSVVAANNGDGIARCEKTADAISWQVDALRDVHQADRRGPARPLPSGTNAAATTEVVLCVET